MATMYRILGKRGRITIPIEMRMRVGFAQMTCCPFQKRRMEKLSWCGGRRSAITVTAR